MGEKASKGRFPKPEKLQNDTNERKRGEDKKEMVALLTFIIATLEIDFAKKRLWDVKGPVGDNVFKNPARYI